MPAQPQSDIPSAWLVAGVVVGVGIGIGAFYLMQRNNGGSAQAQTQATQQQTFLRETRFQRNDDGFVTAYQTVGMPVGVGSGTQREVMEEIEQQQLEPPTQEPQTNGR